MREQLIKEFEELFGEGGDIRTYFAPGRVNLIGEHTDYNGGHVFPCALTIGTYLVARKRDDNQLRFYSKNFPKSGVAKSDLEKLEPGIDGDRWISYPKAIMWTFVQKGFTLKKGYDLFFYGNIPNSSGLSSSSSIGVVTGVMLKDMLGIETISMADIALYAQYAENNYNGVNCGIMDQFIIAMGKKDSAIYLDTATLIYEYAPVKLDNARIVIACSNKKRGLGDSKYNERRSQCEAALADIQKIHEVDTLGDLSIEDFENVKEYISDPICAVRAKHAAYENQRTIAAVEALKNNDIETFGRLMKESHISLRDDYEVTGVELDTLVETAWECEGVIGARMTGAGFGGCTVNIVEKDSIDSFIKKVGDTYLEKIGYAADFYVVDIGDGAGIWK